MPQSGYPGWISARAAHPPDMPSDPAGFPGPRALRFVTAFAVPVRGHCPLHHHRGFEVVLHQGTGGRTTLRDGRSQAFVPGSIVVYPPSQAHAQDAVIAGLDLCVQALPTAPLPPAHDRLVYLPPPLDPWCAAEIADLTRRTPACPEPAQQLVLDHRTTAVLAHLLLHREAVASSPLPPGERLVEQAKELLRAEYRGLRRLDDLAHRLGVSPDHLRHRFTQVAGTSPLGFLTGVRLERAKDLLINTNLPLAAVAAGSGFATARYFCKVFRHHLGCTPTAFRRR